MTVAPARRVAIMQPYLFPHIGYFQLIYAAHLFLIYDDVSFIKQGYINRNRLLSPNGVTRFTVPVLGASSNKVISELTFSTDVSKILKTIDQNYSKAPYFGEVFPLIRETLEYEDRAIASMCQKSYQSIFSYLGLEQQFIKTSELDYDRTQVARDRLITLCRKFRACQYINLPGGRSLYSKDYFKARGVDLSFVDSLPVQYKQDFSEFVPNLSVIDVLMHCSPIKTLELLKKYELN